MILKLAKKNVKIIAINAYLKNIYILMTRLQFLALKKEGKIEVYS